jgi:C_GCAxxG_C_C family probable redox protein
MLASISREEVMNSLNKKVKRYISISGNCAQTTFLALQEQFELEDGAILKALTTFPGGIALRGEACGVVIGCVLAFGLVFGQETAADIAGYFKALPKVREFCQRFEKEMGGITCREIAKADFRKWYSRVDSVESWRRREISIIKHRRVVAQKGVRIAADIILEKAWQRG